MNKNYYSNTMRCMRLFKTKIDAAYKEFIAVTETAMKMKAEDELTVTQYDRSVDKAQTVFKDKRIAILNDAKCEISPNFEAMREIAKQRIVKSPTPEIAATLQILATLDKITPTQFTLYAEQMSDCPLAMQALAQIALTHNQHILVDEPERRLHLLDVLESNLANFLQAYDGAADKAPFMVRRMLPYLQVDDSGISHGGTERIDLAFWNEFVGEGNPDCYNDPSAPAGKPKAQYFFENFDGLMAFINNEIKGESDEDVEKIVYDILSNCPDQYGAAYRCFEASGEKLPLNE